MPTKEDTIAKKRMRRWWYKGKGYSATDKTDLRRKLRISHSNKVESDKITEVF